MGLTIYYELGLPHSCASITPGQRLEELWRQAQLFAVSEISSILHYAGKACGSARSGSWRDPGEFLKACAGAYLTHPDDTDRTISVDPLEIMGFLVWVGRGVEPVALGLARYPEEIDDGQRKLATGLRGWQWHAGCKTQYASVVSMEHFVRCHCTVISLLEAARDLGFTVLIRDDAGYCSHRSEAKLVAEVERMNRLVAAVAGAVADKLGDTGRLSQAPIFAHRDFERLEMEGQREARGER
jgi:hypothetical protein